ncbi:hypothetical protein HML84_18205 [Alcanivorax sp. IO_7]|nr:hypothetical protein HML84_18205 [Alcanivorax sp. IO_7]
MNHFFPGTLIAFCIGPLFALAVGALVIPRFRKARKWRNRAVMPILAGICLLPLMWRMNVTLPFAEMGALLFASLMLFMGGRYIARPPRRLPRTGRGVGAQGATASGSGLADSARGVGRLVAPGADTVTGGRAHARRGRGGGLPPDALASLAMSAR